MTPKRRRTRLARWSTAATREVVYQTDEGLEIDSTEHYELVRRRVLFDDVMLVTYHRELGAGYLIATGIIALIFIAIGILIVTIDASSWPAALVFFIIALPAFLAFALRLMFGVDVVTVFGRRSKASLRFSFRKQRAREAYGLICSAVRNAQRVRPATSPGSVAQPLPEGVPLPPL